MKKRKKQTLRPHADFSTGLTAAIIMIFFLLLILVVMLANDRLHRSGIRQLAEILLHDDWHTVIILLAILYLVLILAVILVMIRNHLALRRSKHTEDTLRILGDTYYAIYRVNYAEGVYESIKSSADVRDILGRSGVYSHLIETVKTCVDEKTYEEFEQSFSLENIRHLIADKVYEFGGDYRRKFTGVNGESEYKWVSIRIIYNDALKLNEVIMCFREIDAEKQRQLQQQMLLENALSSAKATVEKRNTFFSSVSHDMRTPLNAIIGLSDLALRQNASHEKMLDSLKKIRSSGQQLLSLVNDILDMSRIEQSDQRAFDFEPMDLQEWLRQSTALFDTQAAEEQKHLQLITKLEHPVVYCDPLRMSQILENLLSNAFKYSREGDDIQVELTEISSRNLSGKYQIVVSDTGIGMSGEFLRQIFEPFARETTFAPARISGTGLGMPIVKSLVEQLNGEITVRSSLGKGTVITITLPLQIVEDAQQKSADSSRPAPAETSAKTENAENVLSGKTFLTAEDNPINMEILCECLSMLGAHVIEAQNGKEAVERFQSLDENSIDAILMDMQMPVMDGCAASRQIRALPRKDAKTVPIIAVTANAFAEDIAKTSEAGMNGHIAKPIDFRQLADILSKHMQKSEVNHETE